MNTCETCRHWITGADPLPVQACARIVERVDTSPEAGGASLDLSGGTDRHFGSVLRTGPDFGCTLYEPPPADGKDNT